jgi:hypothetical protein
MELWTWYPEMIDCKGAFGNVYRVLVLSCDIRFINIPLVSQLRGISFFVLHRQQRIGAVAGGQLTARGDAQAQVKRRRRTLRHSACRQEGV